jgi:hypothetical protein
MPAALTKTFRWVLVATFVCVLGMAVRLSGVGRAADYDEEIAIAKSLAAMLSAGLTVISIDQDLIDNPDIGDKGLDGKTVLAHAQQLYQESTGSNPLTVDPNSRRGRLLRAEMNAIIEVMDAHQKSLNQRGIGFKGFIPATFGRMIIESFGRGPPAMPRSKSWRRQNYSETASPDRIIGKALSFARNFYRRTGQKDSSTLQLPRAKDARHFVLRCLNIIRPPV